MEQDFYTKEVTEFFVRIYSATTKGLLDWELTANPDILSAPLCDDYIARLASVPDLDEAEQTPDQLLTLLKGQDPLMSVDRKNVSKEGLSNLMRQGLEYPFLLFSDLWMRARAKATRLDLHLSTVNKLLDKKLQGKE